MYKDLNGNNIHNEDWYWSVRWGRVKCHRYSIGWSTDDCRLATGRVLKSEHGGEAEAEATFKKLGILNTFENEEKPFTLDDLRESLTKLQMKLNHGCGNHGCCINDPKGMGTNASCTCSPEAIAKQLRRLSEMVGTETEWIDPIKDKNE